MQITRLSNINFGYNKKLNEDINKKLAKQRGIPEQDAHLLELNKMCMSTEDKLRRAEKDGESNLVTYYCNMLNAIKPQLVRELDVRYPDMEYRDNEIESYNDEIEHKGIIDADNWLVGLVTRLEEDDDFFLPDEDTKTMEKLDKEYESTLENQFQEESKDIREPETIISNENKTPKGAQFVREFIPNEDSPRGFDSLGGMEQLKDMLEDEIIDPVLYPDMAQLDEVEYCKKAPRAVLLYGPPGCGKTSIVQALATESKLPLYELKIANAGSKYVNETASNIQAAFDYLEKIAKENGKPVLLFMDEIEAMTPKRNSDRTGGEDLKLVSTLLPLISEARSKNIIIIGATNCYDRIDEALSNRFDSKKYVGLPDFETRKKVLSIFLNRMTKGQALARNEENLNNVAKFTSGYSNRSLEFLTDKAARIARKDFRRDIMVEDYQKVILDNQNMKIKEDKYKADVERKAIGFTTI